ncbi:Hypothetical protein R9X50_00403800 [Acrodontium crateriforme]|uniref:Uncharacterized protein n=1 Tax=Acrodontium crateriforme TaxID=150365 RepID=A0AAQ3MAA0_9PEZI|nr:Hypothetical protein R9X50_00403800 [Acrodontium crateriforme]
MAASGSKRRSTRQAVSRIRKRSRYAEWESDDDDFDLPSDVEFEPAHSIEPQPVQESVRRKAKLPSRSKRQTRSKSTKPQPRSFNQSLGKPHKRNTHTAPSKKEFTGPSDKKIPPWTSLPINILRSIFLYASHPINDQTTTASANALWLMKAAGTCRAFSEPALEAYYHTPPIFASIQPHRLLELLQTPKEEQYIEYRLKIKSLIIDVLRLAYTAHNRGPFDLSMLVARLPQLQHLEIENEDDLPPFRSKPKQKWYYPGDLFQTFTENQQRLRTWRWSRKMMAERDSMSLYQNMLQIHSSKPFEYVRKLVVCGFNVTDSAEPEILGDDSSVTAPGLATSIAVLPNLKDLTFVSCDVIMEKFLERLPYGLERLELTNCLELHNDMLLSFFAKSGSAIRELVLNHNSALNLAFLPALKGGCPNLEVLKMDFRYFSERENSSDAEPLYDELLKSDEIPTWPTKLRHLELVEMQRWTAEAAKNLFQSLIDSAEHLPALRCLVLHSHINIPWRDRAGFRDQWIARLRRVFLHRTQPPISYLGSLRQWSLWKQAQANGRAGDENHDPPDLRQALTVRISPDKSTGDTDYYSDSPPNTNSRPMRRSTRVMEAQLSQASATASPSPAVESNDDDEQDDGSKTPENFIQGLCEIVDISIDNQRPRENQFTEGDFLDDELSGDEDWQEGADDGEDDRYAW